MRWARRLCGSITLLVLALSARTANAEPQPRDRTVPSGVSSRLELAGSKTIVAGSTRKVMLVVTNRSGAPIDLRELAWHGCTPKFTVALTNRDHPAQVAFNADCRSAPFVLDVGKNPIPFELSSTDVACSQQPALNGPCDPSRGRFLPAGKYRIELFGAKVLPAPEPLKVRVVR